MFKEFFEVRDNEVDIQGVVNHTNYPIYMAHARHKFLHEIGLNFNQMALDNQLLFLTSSNIEYKKSLKPNDKFYVTCSIAKSGAIRVSFEQEIRLVQNDELIAKGINIGVCMDGNRNRPYIPELLSKHFKPD